MNSDAIHISRLRLMAKSAAHYAYGYGETETYAMERGEAVHSLILNEGRRIVSWEKGRPRRGKDYAAFAAANPGALILTDSEGAKARAMAESVLRCPEAVRVLQGQREKQRAWKIGGRDCAGTPDVVGSSYVTELKTCPSSNPDRFTWHSLKLGYHAQLAWYLDGLVLSGVAGVENAYVVAVEAAAPYPVTVLCLTARALEQGRRLYRTWWERLQVCEEADEWPAYAQGVVALDVPDEEQELDFSGLEEEAAA